MKAPEHGMTDSIDELIREAYGLGVSDIHIEPGEGHRYAIRVRVNGGLQSWETGDGSLEQAVSRVKLMARMDIAERRVPQDGSFRLGINEVESIDVRVSSLPTIHGEKVALRLLPNQARLALEELGFDARQLRLFRSWVEAKHGLVLVTGPTGSGKTTTLYATLLHLQHAGVNISTLENPVEIKLPGINQVEIQPRVGLTFMAALRSILRQDPDVLMVGEVRDGETAEAATRAALTGHLVLTSLHSESAVGALLRLIDLGVAPQMVATSVRGVVGQRLVETPKGRRAVFECLTLGEGIRQGLYHRADIHELTIRARQDGSRLLPDILSEWHDRGEIDDRTYDRLLDQRGLR